MINEQGKLKKMVYEEPVCMVFLTECEGILCASVPNVNDNSIDSFTEGDTYNFIWD